MEREETSEMIDIENESILSLTEATKVLPSIDGRRPHVSTLWRWAMKGIRGGVRLETARLGRRVITSKEALQRFIVALSEAPEPQPAPPQPCSSLPKPRSEAQRHHDVEQAKARLRKAGVLPR